MIKKAQSGLEYLLLMGGGLIFTAAVLILILNLSESGSAIGHQAYDSTHKEQMQALYGCIETNTEIVSLSGTLVSNCPGAIPDSCTGYGGNPRAGPVLFNLINSGKGIEGTLTIGTTLTWNESIVHCFYVNDNLVASVNSDPASSEISIDFDGADLTQNGNEITFSTGTGSCGSAPIDEASVKLTSIEVNYCPA